jgi:hypothetical protein
LRKLKSGAGTLPMLIVWRPILLLVAAGKIGPGSS